MPRWRRSIASRPAVDHPAVDRRAADRAAGLRVGDECGSASLEFITVGLILLLPLVYLVLAMAAIQGAAFAVEGAARQAVRVFVQSGDAEEASSRAERAIRFALADAGLDALEPRVSVACTPNPSACLTRLGTVTISVGVVVPLQATATEQVSRFWGAG